MTATPARPAAYIRVAAATTASDPRMDQQRHQVTEAARRLGWPQPAIYAGTGPAAQPGSQHAALADATAAGRHDALIITEAARISRNAAQLRDFARHCREHATPLYLTTGEDISQEITLHASITSQ
jgi:DNA invertase Pin-like site-specific DNA recombinase